MSTRFRLQYNRLATAQRISSSAPAPRFPSPYSPQPPAPSPQSPPRGILLLVVLGLLTLFLFIGTAFVISSNQFRLANRSYQQAGNQENISNTQHNFLDEVLNQLVRDTNNQNSALRYHSLLRDLYGTDGFTATIQNVRWAQNPAGPPLPPYGVTNGQFIEFQITAAQDMLGNNLALPSATPPPGMEMLSAIENYYNGQLVTFVSPSNFNECIAGYTTRIVSYVQEDPTVPNSPYWLRVVATPLSNGQPLTSLANLALLNGTQIVVNGRPFNGTGVGYDPTVTAANTQKLGTGEDVNGFPRLLALMPNAAFFDVTNNPANGAVNSTYFGFPSYPVPLNLRPFDGLGGSDESYDAADFQNMFLAWSPSSPGEKGIHNFANVSMDPTTLSDPGPDDIFGNADDRGGLVLPSFHRPALIHHWAKKTDFWTSGDPVWNSTLGAAANAAILRKILLRPNWQDHPSFTGSNPEFAAATTDGQRLARMIYGPWDVDNDKDGVRESLWVDFGAPIIAGPNGKMVKPLAAILVLDMDGRLNVNAHGTGELAGTINGPNNPGYSLAGVGWNNAPRGQAFGPAEISLEPLLGGNRFERLLEGGMGYSGRYGSGGDDEPGVDGRFDLSAQLKMQGFPTQFVVPRSNFGTLPDLRARYAMGLNDFGQSITDFTSSNNDFDRLTNDNPYELNLSATAPRGEGSSVDKPFSLAEFERLLRAYDIDSPTLPPRLYELLKGNQTTPPINDLNNWRTLLTTDSYDLPEPGFQLPEWTSTGMPGLANSDYASVMGRQPVNATFADLIEYRLRAAQDPVWNVATDTPARISALRTQMALLIAPEMMAGLKLNLNRPLGNGRDDNNNGVVDEPGEFEDAGWQIDYGRAGITATPATSDFEDVTFTSYHDAFDRNGDGTITDFERGDTNGDGVVDNNDDLVSLHNFRRQLLARHLYVLAQAVADPQPIPPGGPSDPTYLEKRAERARQLAQWAINAVDFRDPDNIMTAFEYEVDPFALKSSNAWQVDGNLTTTADWTGMDTQPATNDDTGGVVWGTERPELVMTETLAWHDRRTEDEDNENPEPNAPDSKKAGKVDPASQTYDQDYDQIRPPKGAAFVELYNPWPASPGANNDTHEVVNGNDNGVDLAALDPVSNSSPVWRLAVYKTTFLQNGTYRSLAGPDKDPDSPDKNHHPRVLDRCVYFTGQNPNSITIPDSAGGRAFVNSPNLQVPPVRPGRYLVVGSGDQVSGQPGQYRSHFGLGSSGVNSSRGIVLDTRSTPGTPKVKLVGSNGTDIVASPTSPDIADVAIINEPRRFTISEPVRGYPPINIPGYEDIPHDDQRAQGGGGIGGNSWKDGETRLRLPITNSSSGGQGGIGQPQNPNRAVLRTIPAFSWIYLQRLANPLLPWNKDTNPYLTIDSMGANVTVFNGSDDGPARGELKLDSNGNVVEYPNRDAELSFSSVQRGRSNNPVDAPLPNAAGISLDLLHKGMFLDGRRLDRNRQIDGYLNNDISSTIQANQPAQNLWNPEWIGWSRTSNKLYGIFRNRAGNGSGQEPAGSSDYHFRGIPDQTLGFLNESFSRNTNSQTQPDTPFPWITWNNRPFANPGELMQVPHRRSSQLLQTFSFLNPSATSPTPNQELYRDTNQRKAVEVELSNATNAFKWVLDGPYGHLLNFFRVDANGVDGTAGNSDDLGIAGLYRVLDLVEVPSRYVGTETWLNPQTFGQTLADAPSGPPNKDPRDPRYGWQPPFNRLPERRDPGKVNINTVANGAVWHGVFHGSAKRDGSDPGHPVVDDDDFASFRRGYGQLNDAPTKLDADSPTLFANPFRTSDTGDMVPTPAMLRDGLDSMLLRSSELPATLTASLNLSGDPLFTAEVNQATNASGHKYRDTDRNPYFRYSPISRLSSMTTNRSNVFAVWITVGFFEVEEAPAFNATIHGDMTTYRRIYPDGYQFTKEAGSDTGDFTRVRKFAIVDRTIPVGFQPGANHNVKETVRLKREIE
ncbi:hypothetical protein [Bythopirellula goksoeyrii]|uniref:Uncharacterized protein n=1 Tax=Bythopirellula goksoeyrii TaxID=1400387 RepID=A0A5B9Q629_9BACT|nr:hypothetical protein [Bythopirellula goksoeyrii]QEG34488.1 hypothetical protein Pr1d_17680 [Bythopirellula goksoeyrii]